MQVEGRASSSYSVSHQRDFLGRTALREQGFVPISRRVTSGERLGEVLTCWGEDASCVGKAELEPARHPRAHPRSPTARPLGQRADQQLLSPFCPGVPWSTSR